MKYKSSVILALALLFASSDSLVEAKRHKHSSSTRKTNHHLRRLNTDLLFTSENLKDNGIIGTDFIPDATNDDMYAFSQVIAGDISVGETVKSIDQQNLKKLEAITKRSNLKNSWELAAD